MPEPESIVEILLVGTIHLANPGLDQFNVRVDDVLRPQRQAEIAEVVERLRSFRPTKVAVEARPASTRLARYQEFVAGRCELDRNEVELLGFRLAKQAGLAMIIGIDVEADYYVPEIEHLVTSEACGAIWESIQRTGREAVADVERWLREGTVGEVLYRLNTPTELGRVAAPYRDLLRMSSHDNDAGPRMVANWYARNVRIVGELLRAVVPGDRVFVLFGQGHVPVLRQLLAAFPNVALADPLNYLAPHEVAGLTKAAST